MKIFYLFLPVLCGVLSANVSAHKYDPETLVRDIEAYHSFLQTGFAATEGLNSFVSMGTDTDCDFDSTIHSISDVIDTGVNEIRLASNGVYLDNISIDDQDLVIRGGFKTCTEANSNQQVFSDLVTIDGSLGFTSVIHISGNQTRNIIRLENLDLTGGFSNSGGGLFVDQADAEVHLLRVLIQDNQAIEGGGVSIDFGTVDFFGQDVLVVNNRALTDFGYGGGIFCRSALNQLTLTGMSFIQNNEATRGGGIYSSVCKISMYSELHDESLFFLAGVYDNRTSDVGGGLYLQGRTEVNFFGQQMCDKGICLGSNRVPLLISENNTKLDPAASADGGGIFMQSHVTLTPKLYANGIVMAENQASGNGGAIYAKEGSSVIIERVSQACWERDRCNLIEANRSSEDSGFGGAFYNENSLFDIGHTYIEANRADFGTAFMVSGSEATLTLEHSVLDDNGDEGSEGFSDINVIRVSLGANASIKHSTFADNDAASSVFSVDLLPSSLSLYSSIVHEANALPLFPLATGILDIDCLVSHESNTFSGQNILVSDPEFVDRSSGDFHLGQTSPAIDLCTDASPQKNLDMDMQALGWDDPQIINGIGSYDAGADESYINDIIFKDSFDE
jgi:predicted outer membrane repeat protein